MSQKLEIPEEMAPKAEITEINPKALEIAQLFAKKGINLSSDQIEKAITTNQNVKEVHGNWSAGVVGERLFDLGDKGESMSRS